MVLLGVLTNLACVSRPNVDVCQENSDCPSGQVCILPVTRTRGLCAPLEDAGLPDAGREPAFIFREHEQYAVRLNDEVARAETDIRSPPVVIEGVLGTPNGFTPDVDHFEIPVRLTSVLAIKASGDMIHPKITFFPKAQPDRAVTAIGDNGSAEREVFAPGAGSYVLRIEDADRQGGIEAKYRIEIDEVLPSVAQLESGTNERTITTQVGGSLPAYRIDVVESAVLIAEVAPTMGMEVDLYVWRFSAPSSVLTGKRLSTGGGRVAQVVEPGSYRLIVVATDLTPVPIQVPLKTRVVDGSDETEPNDDLEHPSPFISPTAGAIGAPTTTGDTDVFELPRPPGQVVDIEVRSSGMMVPKIVARAGSRVIAEQLNEVGGPTARLGKVLLPADAPLTLVVTDRRNEAPGAPVGGAGFDYILEVTPVERAPGFIGTLTPTTTPMSSNRRLEGAGERDWSRFVVADVEGVIVVRARSGPGFEALVSLYDEDGLSVYYENQPSGRLRFLSPGQYWVSVADQRGRPMIDYSLEFARVPFIGEDIRPGQLVPIPGLVRGTVQALGVDKYSVELGAERCLQIATLEGSASSGANLDTRLTLTTTTGVELAFDDNGGIGGVFSRVVARLSGTVVVKVEASRFGAYLLSVEESTQCP